MIWKLLDHFYITEAWGDYTRISPLLLFMMDKLRGSLPIGYKIKIHRAYSDNNPNSLHSLGCAVDFHIVGCSFLEAEYHVKNFLLRKKLINEIEFGIYPDWSSPGFHLGIQKNGGSWGARYINEGNQNKQQYFTYNDILRYAKNKFKEV